MNLKSSNMFHGKLSVILVGVATIIGLISLILSKSSLTIAYIVLLVISPFSIAYFYCRNCPCCHDRCYHVIFGKITKLFKPKRQGAYKPFEIVLALLPIICATVVAQFSLVQNLGLLISFWIVFLIAFIEIRICVCPKCDNKMCPLNKTS